MAKLQPEHLRYRANGVLPMAAKRLNVKKRKEMSSVPAILGRLF
jgi:hypothetical protein